MQNRRAFLKTAALAGLSSPLILRSGAALAANYQAYTYLTVADKPGVIGLQSIADALTKASGDAIKIQVNLGGSLPIKASDTTQALGDGVIKLADNQFYLGVVPIAGLLRLPMLVSDVAEYEKAYAVLKPYLKSGFSRQGVTVIGHYVYPPQVIWGVKEIRSLADLDGKKIRVTSAEQGKFVEQFGGFPITLPSSELAPSLQRNLIDGLITASAGGARTLGDLLKYNYRINTSTVDSMYMVNNDFLDGLKQPEREALLAAADKGGKQATELLAKEEPVWTEKLQKQGITVTAADPKDVAKATKELSGYWGEWAKQKGGKAPEALAAIRKVLGK